MPCLYSNHDCFFYSRTSLLLNTGIKVNNNSRILIIDDSDAIHDILDTLLTPEGYQLAFAINGAEGLEKANQFMPDLILLDVMMPGMDGFEVCERLRAMSKLAEVPIIMLTALDDRESRLRALEAGVDDFLTKPFDRTELRVRINSMTRLNRYRRLLTERSRFEWVIQQLDDGFLLLTGGSRIRYMNSAARVYLGIDNNNTEDFLQQVDKIYKREPIEAWENWPAANNAKSPRYLVRPETSEAPALWLQVDVSEFSADDNDEQLLHLYDVSEKMQLLQRMWSFQAMVSHKLRNPLNSFAILPLIRDSNEFSRDTEELFDLLETAIDHLQNRVLEVLQYVDTSSLLKVNDSFRLSEIRNLVMTLQDTLELDMLKFAMDESLQDKALLLSGQALEIVLYELLKNAKKFHPENSPKIELLIKLAETDNTIVLSVTDNGQHLPKNALKKVWTAYYQYEKNFSGEVQGMGLGLPMVARLIWANGGDCRLCNREDQSGVRVELMLPLTSSIMIG